MELAKAYNPKEAEEHHYKRWEESGFFAPEINQDAEARAYSIVIPPPNVTGSLHMGHALQHTLMDVLIRRKRMQGFRTLWLPGTDHAGISVQRKIVEPAREIAAVMAGVKKGLEVLFAPAPKPLDRAYMEDELFIG